MQIKQLTYGESKQYELLTIISLMLISLTVGFILVTLIQNETAKLARINFLQDIKQNIRSADKIVRTNLSKGIRSGTIAGTNLLKDITTKLK